MIGSVAALHPELLFTDRLSRSLSPVSVYDLLPQSVSVVMPISRVLTSLDLRVCLESNALLRNRDKSCINDLAAAGLKALGTEIGLKHLKELLDDISLAKSLSEGKDGVASGMLYISQEPLTPRRKACQ